VFRISDRDDNALGDAQRDALRDALQAGIEGEP
jgi:hypothetical protein